jgi:hypothetical protein
LLVAYLIMMVTMSNTYSFVSHWRLLGTAEEVATILADADGLKRWWPSVYLDVHEIEPGDERGVGREVSLYTKGWLPYTLRWSFRVTDVHFPHGFRIEAWGDFVGTGIWTITQDGAWVNVVYEWNVSVQKELLKRLSFVLRPIFEANHRWAMAKGEESLRLELLRRRATTPEGRALIPPPPGTTSKSPLPLLAAGLAGVGVLALVVYGVRRRLARGKPRRFQFNPDRIARFEAAGWRAYYDRDWPRLLRLLVGINREQFRMPFPQSLLGAYYVTRAAVAWSPKKNNPRLAHRFYERFYNLAKRYSGLSFDPSHVAALELRYNDVHRRLSGLPDKQEFVRTMTQLHSALFGIPPALARQSAELRVLANNVVDQITGKRSLDPEADWQLLETYLRGCYRSIQRALNVAAARS